MTGKSHEHKSQLRPHSYQPTFARPVFPELANANLNNLCKFHCAVGQTGVHSSHMDLRQLNDISPTEMAIS